MGERICSCGHAPVSASSLKPGSEASLHLWDSNSGAIADDRTSHLTRLTQRALSLEAAMSMLFPDYAFVDRAWFMMLALANAHAERRTLCVKDLILLSEERATSALRRVARLQAAGLIGRRPDRHDRRRVLIHLTPAGLSAMTAMLSLLDPSGS